jgi:hypothetical protein
MSNGEPIPFHDQYGTMHLNHDIRRDREEAIRATVTADNIKPAVAEVLDGITPPTSAREIIDTAFNLKPTAVADTGTNTGISLRLAPDQIVTLIRYEVEKLCETIKDRSGHFRVDRRHIEDRSHEIAKLVMALPETIEL